MNTFTYRDTFLAWSITMLMTVFVVGCGSDSGGGGGGSATAQPGTLTVSLTDAPACGFDEVNVSVSKVRVHQSDSASDNTPGWTDITVDPARNPINLLNLNDPTQPNLALESLGETPLAAGHYTQLRLVLVPNSGGPPFANSVVRSGTTTEIALDTPSGTHSGIKLVHQFTVSSGQRVDLLLDFDACKSIVARGNGTYGLKPVIKVIPIVLNGIEGFVDKSLLGNNVAVSAQVNGEIVRSTMPNTQTGKFFLARLDAPEHYDVVTTADGHAASVISGVPVTSSTSITPVSTDSMPIGLQTSTSRTVNGTVTLNPPTDDETVFLAAKQSLTSGPTVTVKSQTAMLLMGPPTGNFSYALTLPVAAPSLGPYTPLPIVFTQQPASVAGKYSVQASAAGYQTQSSNVDISAANAVQDFALVP